MTINEEAAALHKTLSLIEQEGENKKYTAGMQGAYHDGGGGALLDQVKFYRYGMKGIIPKEWDKYHKQAKSLMDPEWDEYQRLRKKFDE